MDPKTIAASTILAIAASVGITKITNKTPRDLTVKAGATSLDQAVADTSKLGDRVETINAELRASVVNDSYGLHWWCGAVPCPKSLTNEIARVSERAVLATLTPSLNSDTVEFKIEVFEGDVPKLATLSPEDEKLLGVREVAKEK